MIVVTNVSNYKLERLNQLLIVDLVASKWFSDSVSLIFTHQTIHSNSNLHQFYFSGLDNAGKTTILKRLNGEDIDTIEPTLGFNINTLEHRGYTLNFWDVGGQKSLRSYWRNYFESTDGLVWVVDSADKMRLANCKEELHSLLQEERLAGATLLVLANKQDVPGALSSKDIKDVGWMIRSFKSNPNLNYKYYVFFADIGIGSNWNSSLECRWCECRNWWKVIGFNWLADWWYCQTNIYAWLILVRFNFF